MFLSTVPITAIYSLFIVFTVGLTSSPFTAFVVFSQLMFSILTFIFAHNYDLNHLKGFNSSYAYILITFYGFWDLDFSFLYFIPTICISTTFSMLDILLLPHVVIVNPILLICLTWLCTHLYSQYFKILVWIWQKFSPLYNKIKNKRDSKCTAIDMFSTFLLLSYSKSLEQLLFILKFQYNVILYNTNNLPTRRLLSIDPSIKLFGLHHLLFILVPFILFSIIFIPLVTILALYPLKRCRPICLKCACGGHRRAALNIFVEKFYSCYRDGLDGGRDMRSFASLYFIFRFIIILLTIITEPLLLVIDFPRITLDIILTSITAFFIALIQLYKKYYMNILDSLILANLAFVFLLIEHADYSQSFSSGYAIVIASSIPMWALCLYVIYKIF